MSITSCLRPYLCAILGLIFTLANVLFVLVVIATLFMGLGVAITIGCIGLGAIAAQRGLFRFLPTKAAGSAGRYIGMAGAVIVILLGLTLILGVISGGSAAA